MGKFVTATTWQTWYFFLWEPITTFSLTFVMVVTMKKGGVLWRKNVVKLLQQVFGFLFLNFLRRDDSVQFQFQFQFIIFCNTNIYIYKTIY